ncbi:hypothetical protein P4V41_07475 [Fictibacillus nanhaiensis]|uniref:hypothetical protein n=1 Tax=Fictibacillus nanhaiensis TaxID=742169 RepID=UPI002E1FD0AA|nr:hypothetical protein [Fictibacillus nanhaiensis]
MGFFESLFKGIVKAKIEEANRSPEEQEWDKLAPIVINGIKNFYIAYYDHGERNPDELRRLYNHFNEPLTVLTRDENIVKLYFERLQHMQSESVKILNSGYF